jgi:hypothetical protein
MIMNRIALLLVVVDIEPARGHERLFIHTTRDASLNRHEFR